MQKFTSVTPELDVEVHSYDKKYVALDIHKDFEDAQIVFLSLREVEALVLALEEAKKYIK